MSVYSLFIDRTIENHSKTYLRSLDLSNEEREKLEKSFSILKTLFRKNVLAIVSTSYPRAYKRYAKFKTWEELEKYVETISPGRQKER